MLTVACIDADIVAYRCAAVNENADLGLAIWQTDQLLTRILEDTNADDWRLYLSGENNFRYEIFPEYKANRREQPKPKHLEGLREYLVVSWNARICDGYEADDALGIEAYGSPDKVIICSIDKDLLQLRGTHYNFVKREIKEINEFGGAIQFYSQLLIGDPTDNIRGCPGIGKVKAQRAFIGCNTERQLYDKCVELYKIAYKDTWERELTLNAQLLYVWKRDNDSWIAPLPEQPVQELVAEPLS